MERSGSHRLRSLLDVKVDSPNPNSLAGLTLTAVLENHRPPVQTPANRTLFHLTRDDGSFRHNKKSWKLFRDKIRLGRAGAAWVSSIRTPTSDVPIVNKKNNKTMISRRNSVRQATPEDRTPEPGQSESNSGPALHRNLSRTPSMAASPSMIHQGGVAEQVRRIEAEMARAGREVGAVAAEAEAEAETETKAVAEEDGEEEPVRMSLMALLADADGEMGSDGSKYMMDGDDEEEEDEDEAYSNCCVCRVRHKGASSLACGHTYCRLCSRELFVEGSNCPLCNRFVMEILDFF
ncbi:uncharacterized protein LOC132309421 [Cornus florida]|uniref:uncharacterized protein LOC132309421 n=1 Tax=Cornus florida TaxID=4283 RepID=UPI00289A6610|nr:uncharacterized protein LOC132309421 [Cornus florida]